MSHTLSSMALKIVQHERKNVAKLHDSIVLNYFSALCVLVGPVGDWWEPQQGKPRVMYTVEWNNGLNCIAKLFELLAPYMVCNSITNGEWHFSHIIILSILTHWTCECYISQVSLMAVSHTISKMPLKIVQHERKNEAKFRPLREGESRLIRAFAWVLNDCVTHTPISSSHNNRTACMTTLC